MAIGRPKSLDPPEKYRETYELFLLTRTGGPAEGTAADEIAGFLEWAIQGGQAGFAVGDIISIGALASGVDKSRNTAAKAVERLVALGMVIKGKQKSPYRIVSASPIFKDAGLVADENISLTIKTETESHFSEVKSFALNDRQNMFANFLTRELELSKDPLIKEARKANWREGEVQLLQRLRVVHQDHGKEASLAELTFLRLGEEHVGAFRAKVAQLKAQKVRQISLYPILEQCGITELRAGRTQICVAPPPHFLARELREYTGDRDVDWGYFGTDQPMLKWTYALFQPHVAPMVSFSVCYVRSDLLGIFIRKMDVELDRQISDRD